MASASAGRFRKNLLHRQPAIWGAAAIAALGAGVVLAVGCGNQYRPVITPINPTGPAALPSGGIIVISQPGFSPVVGGTVACSGATYTDQSIITLVNFSGDSTDVQANGGYGPL